MLPMKNRSQRSVNVVSLSPKLNPNMMSASGPLLVDRNRPPGSTNPTLKPKVTMYTAVRYLVPWLPLATESFFLCSTCFQSTMLPSGCCQKNCN